MNAWTTDLASFPYFFIHSVSLSETSAPRARRGTGARTEKQAGLVPTITKFTENVGRPQQGA